MIVFDQRSAVPRASLWLRCARVCHCGRRLGSAGSEPNKKSIRWPTRCEGVFDFSRFSRH